MVQLLGWTDITRGRFYEWKKRYGKANEHNGKIPRDHWIEPWEGQAMIPNPGGAERLLAGDLALCYGKRIILRTLLHKRAGEMPK